MPPDIEKKLVELKVPVFPAFTIYTYSSHFPVPKLEVAQPVFVLVPVAFELKSN